MTKLTIFILCHNRPDDTRKVIQSALAQSDPDFHLVISDNSSSDEVQHLVAREFPSVPYVRRVPMVPALEHFNLCIAEAQSDYFCLFHDDDILENNFVAKVKQAMLAHPQAVAIGCNARIESFGKIADKPSFLAGADYELIHSARQLAQRYFSRYQSGIAPFPSYVYQRRLLGAHRFHTNGGKYSDVTWLLDLAQAAPIVWIKEALMIYRHHASNDGNTESRRDRLRFLAYLKQHRERLGEDLLQDYRCSFIYKPLCKTAAQRPAVPHAWRTAIAAAFLRHYRWRRHLRASTYQALVRRALTKWASQ